MLNRGISPNKIASRVYVICFLILSGCSFSASNNSVNSDPETAAPPVGSDITTWSNPTSSTVITSLIPDGLYSSKNVTFTENNLVVSNIKNGLSIFGVVGTYTGTFRENMASTAFRNPASIPIARHLDLQTTSHQLSLNDETQTYAGASLPSTAGYIYRDIPDVTKDDDGALGTTCKYAPRPASDCGLNQTTIESKIADCAITNPTTSTWNGATQCSSGEGTWNLVTRAAANKEVWRDSRTRLIWSSYVSGLVSWCQASGNTQAAAVTYHNAFNTAVGTPFVGNGTIENITGGTASVAETVTVTFSNATTFSVSGTNCGGGSITSGALTTTPGSSVTFGRTNYCQFTLKQGSINFAANDKIEIKSVVTASSCTPGTTYQDASPISYCAEAAGLNPGAGDNWGTASYSDAKGRMGKNTIPSVAWRLPTLNDTLIANVNGLRFVLPDASIPGTDRPDIDGSPGNGLTYTWTATTSSYQRGLAFMYDSKSSITTTTSRNGVAYTRCVGR